MAPSSVQLHGWLGEEGKAGGVPINETLDGDCDDLSSFDTSGGLAKSGSNTAGAGGARRGSEQPVGTAAMHTSR